MKLTWLVVFVCLYTVASAQNKKVYKVWKGVHKESTPRECPWGQVKLGDGQTCFSNRKTCDGKPDLASRADEDPAFCENFTCPLYYDKLPDNRTCVFESILCNGKVDTYQGTDEEEGFCKKYTCPSSRTQLADGKTCMFPIFICNGRRDIASGIDEDNDFCETFQCPDGYHGKSLNPYKRKKCPAGGEFKNAVCVPHWRRCPGEPEPTTTAAPDVVPAPATSSGYIPACKAAFCVPGWTGWKDGHKKSKDKGPAKCPWREVKLGDGQTCFSNRKTCDGKPDLASGADEDPAFCETFQCPDGYIGKTALTYKRKKCPAGGKYGNAICVRYSSRCPGEREPVAAARPRPSYPRAMCKAATADCGFGTRGRVHEVTEGPWPKAKTAKELLMELFKNSSKYTNSLN